MPDAAPFSYQDGKWLIFVGSKVRFESSQASFTILPENLVWASLGTRSPNVGGFRFRFQGPRFEFVSEIHELFVGAFLQLRTELEELLDGRRVTLEFRCAELSSALLHFVLTCNGDAFVAEARCRTRSYDDGLRDPQIEVAIAFPISADDVGRGLRELNEMLQLASRFEEPET